MFFIKYSFWF